MASWTQIDNWLPEQSDVLAMKDALNVPLPTILGGLMLFWRQVNREATRVGDTDDMRWDTSADVIDGVTHIPGFAGAMPKCWLTPAPFDDGYVIPGYWPRCDQRTRALDSSRKAAKRVKKGDVRSDSAGIPRNPVTNPNPNPSSNPKQTLSASADRKQSIPKADIEAIYAAYPKKVGRGGALKEIKIALRKIPFDNLLPKVQAYAESVASKRGTEDWGFVPHPERWFKKERWSDEPEAKPEPVDMDRFYKPDGSLK